MIRRKPLMFIENMYVCASDTRQSYQITIEQFIYKKKKKNEDEEKEKYKNKQNQKKRRVFKSRLRQIMI